MLRVQIPSITQKTEYKKIVKIKTRIAFCCQSYSYPIFTFRHNPPKKIRKIFLESKNPNSIKGFLMNRYFYIGLGILFFGILVNQISSSFIIRYGGNLPVLSDLILDNIPYYNFGYIYDIFNILCLGIFIMYIVFRKQYKNFPYFLALFGILYLIRGIFIVLTPFGSPVASYTDLFSKVSEVFNFGMYPSGHTGSSFLAFLLAKGIYKWIIFVCIRELDLSKQKLPFFLKIQ